MWSPHSFCVLYENYPGVSSHPKGLLWAIEIIPFLMGAAAEPLLVVRDMRNIRGLQQVFEALEVLIL